jgi:hypothetical protein
MSFYGARDYIDWIPISGCPDRIKKNRIVVLLWFRETDVLNFSCGAIEGWWFENGWETSIGSIGEPSHFAYLNRPPEPKPRLDDNF